MQAEDYSYLYELEEHFWWFAGMREITATLLDPFVLPKTHDKLSILDAGCGTGGNLTWLARYAAGAGGRTTGIDMSRDAVRFCREREHERLLQASVVELPFADSAFDLVTSFDVLQQLPAGEADVQAADEIAIGEMYRVLKPGGVCLTRVAAYEWMRSGHDAALGTQKRYTLRALAEKMQRAGFTILRTTYANSLLLPFVAARRLLLKPLGLADKGSDVKPLAPGMNWLNHSLENALRSEARLLKNPRRSLRAGLSAICIAAK